MSTTTLNKSETDLVNVMQALGDPTRFSMFKIMLSEQNLCVSEIATTLGISVPAVSQHFRIFEYLGLVDKKRNGQKVCYALKQDNATVREFKAIIKEET